MTNPGESRVNWGKIKMTIETAYVLVDCFSATGIDTIGVYLNILQAHGLKAGDCVTVDVAKQLNFEMMQQLFSDYLKNDSE